MASYASVRQVLQPKCTKYSQFQLSPSWVVPCSLVFKTKYISRFSRLHEFSSHQNLIAASKATLGNDAKENEDGVSLGTMKLPLDIDIPRFESLLFQVLLTLSRSSEKRLTPIEELTSLDLKIADLGCYRFCYSWLLLAFGIPLLITLIVLVVSLCNKVYAQEIEDDKAINYHELIDEENLQLNSATAGRMTIFGESNEVHSEPEINNDAGLPIEGNSIYDDITEVSCLLDYKCDEPTTFFDVAEEYMILPFLEDTMEASGNHDGRTCEDTIIESDDSSLYLAIHQLRSCNEEPDVNPYSYLDQLECFDPHKFIRNLPDLPDVAPKFHPTTLLNES
ncbi:hypothetical protein LOK49_LG04G02431 [Camellia lanceoleosa]|uniref:Uncharacterized protein n=1 Tax=Camellia lanceoleosa TaxID=1840588 RepID=A0ACC0I0Z3_9ERIC|nr:hypothetical protein LOK49_LG04G02431 [Camellia lanceoleosa]